MEKEIQELNNLLQMVKQKAGEKIQELQQVIQDQRDENEDLRTQLETRNSKIESLEAIILELRESLREHAENIDLDKTAIQLPEPEDDIKQIQKNAMIVDKTNSINDIGNMETKSINDASSVEENRNAKIVLEQANMKLQSELEQSLSEIEYLRSKTTELIQCNVKQDSELIRLREHLLTLEENSTHELIQLQSLVEEYKMQIYELESERDQWKSIEQRNDEVLNLQSHLDKVQAEMEEKECLINNLQQVLQQFSKEKDDAVQESVFNLEHKIQSLNEVLKERDALIQSLESELEQRTKNIEQQEQHQQDLAQKNEIIGNLRYEVAQLQSHLSEAIKMMRKGGGEESVDRNLMVNLLIQFINVPYGDKKRFEILKLISNVLNLGTEEQEKIGLIRKRVDDSTSPHEEVIEFNRIFPICGSHF